MFLVLLVVIVLIGLFRTGKSKHGLRKIKGVGFIVGKTGKIKKVLK